MFGSNNYLGLANHPRVREHAMNTIRTFGTGIAGPPLLNGYTCLHRELESRLAALKGNEDALLFSSGYNANVGLVTGLTVPGDVVLYDALSHASFYDGLKMSGVIAKKFRHNKISHLEMLLNGSAKNVGKDLFVAVEGIYSMDGDLAPLHRLAPLCKKYSALLIVDDAHGTGVLGATGRGTAEHFGVENDIDITMGTFSKVFAVTGGFITAAKPIISYLRFFARSYMFSASLPPMVLASVLSGLDVLEDEPERLTALHENVQYLSRGLCALGFNVKPQSAIIPIRVPESMNIRKAAYEFHRRGIFINAIEYPAVPLSQQRFRISVMTTHTKSDLDRLLAVVGEIWTEHAKGHFRLKKRSFGKAA
jgi:glycine C-acetyltransferase